ncbi:MAG TPA: hypothetical protein VMV52_01350 [Candidatus Nanopelagicaceae bacterium]|nr:hypothetical protein [Candidatus Nanopelagicaceae bacterium]
MREQTVAGVSVLAHASRCRRIASLVVYDVGRINLSEGIPAARLMGRTSRPKWCGWSLQVDTVKA